MTTDFDVGPAGRLVVDFPVGKLRVDTLPNRSGEQAQVLVAVRRFGLSPMARIRSYQQGDVVVVEGHRSQLRHRLPPWSFRRVRIDVSVPEEFDVEIRTQRGSIEVAGVRGEVVARSWDGRLRFRDISGSIVGRTAGGSIEVDDCTGDVAVRSAAGRIDVDHVGGSVAAKTRGGAIQVQGARGDVEVRTPGGSIEAIDVGGELNAQAAGGGIRARVEGAPAGELEPCSWPVRSPWALPRTKSRP